MKWLVEEKGISPSNIGIYGQSLGALTALTTPAKSNNFAAIAVHDPPVDFETLVKEEMVYKGFLLSCFTQQLIILKSLWV